MSIATKGLRWISSDPLKLLAGLTVTTKAVERTAEAIGEDIEQRQQQERKRALRLELAIPIGLRIAVLYVEMDGTGIPVLRKETEGRAGKQEGQPAHTREAKLGCVFTQTGVDEEGYPIRTKLPPAMWAPSRAARNSAVDCMAAGWGMKLGGGGWA